MSIDEKLDQILEELRKRNLEDDEILALKSRVLDLEKKVDKLSKRNYISKDQERWIDTHLKSMDFRVSNLENASEQTGLFNSDVLATGMSKTTNDKSRQMLDLIRDMFLEQQRPVPIDEVISSAEKDLGFTKEMSTEIIKRLRTNGSIFEPRTNFLKLP